jgi:hypothetical protein
LALSLKFKTLNMKRPIRNRPGLIRQSGFLLLSLALSALISFQACSSQRGGGAAAAEPELLFANRDAAGLLLEVEFRKGPAHNHPLMAVWIEDTAGNYIETLYVAASIGTGIFGHGRVTAGHWEPGPVKRPAALPYWWHKYGGLPDVDNPVPDAITGPTPTGDFRLQAVSTAMLPDVFYVLLEVNQSWDWNEYWTNTRYPGNADYMSSSQPALVYAARLEKGGETAVYEMKLIGHSHYAGADGELYRDISTFTTAKNIAAAIRVRIIRD